MRYAGRNRRRRLARRFFTVLIFALVGSWVAYHGFSYLTLKTKPAQIPASDSDLSDRSAVVAQMSPKTDSTVELPLLAGAKRAPSTRPAPKETVSDIEVEQVLAAAKELTGQGKIIPARKVLNDYLAEHFESPSSNAVRTRALELGKQTILGAKIYPDDPVCQAYRIDAGDTLVRLAKKNKVPYQFLCKINQIIDPRRLMEGQQIKLPKGPIHLKVIKHELMLYVFLQDVLFAKYDVCLGKDGKTPDGKWLVEDRIRRPVYVDPDTKQIFGPNDPNNPTGGFWIRLKGLDGDAVGKTGFGVHGTNEPDSVKKFLSKGCIRLRNEDMAQVFDLLTPGSSQVYTLP
ncbi:MAG: L,D-transpeptidase family protein [Phycisphaerae bacterium]